MWLRRLWNALVGRHTHGVDRTSAHRVSPRAWLQAAIGEIDVHMKSMCCNGPLTF